MARIRSTHPGQWTDEDFVQCSPLTRLLVLALRNEADDHGVFEWKPLTIKMRLFPVDNVNVDEMLAEAEKFSQIQKFEVDGKSYGAIRNFCKYQRPKKPTYIYPLPNSMALFVACSDTSTEPVPHQFPTSTEKSPQRKEEGGREGGREEKKEHALRAVDSSREDFEAFWQAYPHKIGKGQAVKAFKAAIRKVPIAEMLEGIKRYVAHKPTDIAFCNPATWLNGERWLDQVAVVTPIANGGNPEVSRWKARVTGYQKNRFWLADQWGPPPDSPGFKGPRDILQQSAA
jgi:hypothetical protein